MRYSEREWRKIRTHHGIYRIALCWDTFCGIIWISLTNHRSNSYKLTFVGGMCLTFAASLRFFFGNFHLLLFFSTFQFRFLSSREQIKRTNQCRNNNITISCLNQSYHWCDGMAQFCAQNYYHSNASSLWSWVFSSRPFHELWIDTLMIKQ